MYLLHIEHSVPDYEVWRRNGFDSDPLGRRQMGVVRHRVGRRADDPNHVMIDLEFATKEAATGWRRRSSRCGSALRRAA